MGSDAQLHTWSEFLDGIKAIPWGAKVAAASTSSGWVTLGLMYTEQEWVWKSLFIFSRLHRE